MVNDCVENVPSHNVIEKYISKHGCDYRFEVAPNPIPELRNRREDNFTVGRTWGCHRYVRKEDSNS